MRARSGRSSTAKGPTSWPSTFGTNGSRSPEWIPTCRPQSFPPDRRSPTAPGPGEGHRRVRPTAIQGTARAISRPSAVRRLPGLRPPCSAGPRRSRARSLTATPAPATTSAGAPTARAGRVPQKSIPATPLGDQFEAYHYSTTYYAFQRRGTLESGKNLGLLRRALLLGEEAFVPQATESLDSGADLGRRRRDSGWCLRRWRGGYMSGRGG